MIRRVAVLGLMLPLAVACGARPSAEGSVGSPSPSYDLAIAAEIPVPGFGEIAIGGGALWVLDVSGTLYRVDPASHVVSPIAIFEPTGRERYGLSDVAVGHGSVWVTNGEDSTLVRVDPATLSILERIPIGQPTGGSGGTVAPLAIGLDDGAVWVANHHGSTDAPNGSIVRVDPATNAVDAVVPLGSESGGGPGSLVVRPDGIWVGVPSLESVERVDPESLEPVGSVAAGRGCGSLLDAGEAIWAGCDGLFAIDPRDDSVAASVSIEAEGAITLAGDAAGVWARSRQTGVLYRVDLRTNEVVARLQLTPGELSAAVAIEADGESVWARELDTLLRIQLVPPS